MANRQSTVHPPSRSIPNSGKPAGSRPGSSAARPRPSGSPRKARRSRPQRRIPPILQAMPAVLLSGFAGGALLAWVASGAPTSVEIALPDWLPSAPLSGIDLERSQAKAAQLLAQNPITPVQVEETDPFALHGLANLSYVPSIMYHDVVGTSKQVWFDTTAAELRQHFEAIKDAGVTPISIDQLYRHLKEGEPLPEKAILLTFDDAYLGQYDHAYPLLKEYNYPAAYFVQTGFVGVPTSKDHFTWDQMREMVQDGLVSIAAHTINHPSDLRTLDPARLKRELEESKRILEAELGQEIPYFAYPTGYRNEQVVQAVKDAGYKLAFTMDKGFTGQSPNLLEVRRFNQFQLTEALVGAQTLLDSRLPTYDLTVTTPLAVAEDVIDRVRMTTIRGGRPATIHADQRYNVGTLMKRYQAPAGINGSFFSIPWINSSSNIMIGPVLSASTNTFIPGREEDNAIIRGRPLVLIGQDRISFIPFEPDTMNTLEEIQAIMPDVTDLFVGGTWLVKNGQPLNRSQINSFKLSSAAEYRPRAFFGVDTDGRVVAGTTDTHIDATILADILPQAGIEEAILLDSGFSTSLVYKDEILATGHASATQPSRPVPHAILLYDLTELWADPDPQDPVEVDRLDQIVELIPASYQAVTYETLQAVLDQRLVLRQGDRGPAVTAVQVALGQLARSQARYDLLPSGPDGVYGNEVAQALAELGFGDTPSTDAPHSSAQDPATLQPSEFQPTAYQDQAIITQAPITVIDGTLLQSVLDSFRQAPPAVLVDTDVPRQIPDLTQKPRQKLSSPQVSQAPSRF